MTSPITLTVGGSDLTAYGDLGTLDVKECGTRERGALEVELVDAGTAVSTTAKSAVTLYDAADARYVFTGVLNPAGITAVGVGRRIKISCTDLGELLDQSLVPYESRPAESFYARITYLVSTYGPLLPATWTYVEALAGTLPAAVYENTTLRGAIEQTCSLQGPTCDYFLDGAGLLHAGTALLGAAPFAIRLGTPGVGEIAPDDFEATLDPAGIVNAYYVRGTNAAGSGWVTDAASILAWGRREAYLDAPDADTGAKRDAVGNAALNDSKSPAVQGTFSATAANGFRPGQTLTVAHAPSFNIADGTTFRVNTVERTYTAGGTVKRYAVQFGGALPLWSTSGPAPQSWPGQRIARGSLSLTPFADSIRPVAIVAALPSLPDALYPADSYVVLSTTHRLYKNVSGAWALGVDGADIVADSITAGQIAVGAVSASEIAAGAVSADKIAVGAVGSDKINGSPRNLVSNPGFENVVSGEWSSSFSRASNAPRTGTYSGGLSATTTIYPTSSQFSVAGGRRYYCSAWARGHNTNTTNFAMYFRIRWLNAAGATISDVTVGSANIGQSVTWTNFRGFLTAPSNASSAFVILIHYGAASQSWAWWDDFEVYEADQDISHAGGNVVIDSSGITISNGALTLMDEYGTSSATASGFDGDWADFISNGLYNSRFLHGVAGTIPAGRTSALPYWTASVTSATLTYAAGSAKCAWSALAGAGSITSDRVSIQPSRWYEVTWVLSANVAAGSVKIQPYVYWYDSAKAYISYSAAANLATTATLAVQPGPSDSVRAPDTAYYAAVRFDMSQLTTHSASNWGKVHAASLRPSTRSVAPLRCSDSATAYVASSSATHSTALSTYDIDSFGWVQRAQAATSLNTTMYGLKAPTYGKHLLVLMNYSGYTITLKHESASAGSASVRFNTPGGVDFVISAYGSATLLYNDLNSRWHVLAK